MFLAHPRSGGAATAGLAPVSSAARVEAGVPRSELVRLDAELARRARAGGASRLRLGEALERLGSSGWHHELGFSSMAAYAQQACGRSGRWAGDARAVARNVAPLAKIRAALRSGRISWSMAQLLCRHATSDTQDLLLEASDGRTERPMKAWLADRCEHRFDVVVARSDMARGEWSEWCGVWHRLLLRARRRISCPVCRTT